MEERNMDTAKIEKMEIFFGHQSVGQNIIEGIGQIDGNIPVYSHPPTDSTAGIYHVYIGENGNPKRKIDEFVKMAESIPDTVKATTFMKFCFLDIDETTDINSLFDYYKAEMETLGESKGNLNIIHFTVPLMAKQTGLKAAAKKILGKNVTGTNDNLNRFEFNELIRKSFGKRVFDLAKYESTLPDGSRLTAVNTGVPYEILYPEYSDDGSHLNKSGSRYIAEELFVFLASQM